MTTYFDLIPYSEEIFLNICHIQNNVSNFSGTNELLKPGQIRVTLGEHDLTRAEEPKSKDVRLSQIIPHPRHKCGRASDDLALIRLAEDIVWSESVTPACLPDGPNGNTYTDFSGRLAVVAGWGWLGEVNSNGRRV